MGKGNVDRSKLIFDRAKKVIPGGVNSPVRAFNSVGGTPRFIQSASGATITDVDGNVYLDYIGSWGPMILGHANPMIIESVQKAVVDGLSFGAATEREVIMAELITDMIKPVEMVRMVNSGTEAVMSAIRAARGYTKRERIIKFEGCYHGHADSMLVKAGSGALTIKEAADGSPDSGGVTVGTAKDTLTAQYNNLDSVRALMDQNKGQIACIIVEPVAANMGVVLPQDGFLQGLRKICDENGTVLIFDEVITGFRLALGGAMEHFGVQADLVTYGKIIGGGMPVGAYGGKREIMQCIAPVGNVYQAGTLSGNPIAMMAGLTTLTYLKENPSVYENINRLGDRLAIGLKDTTEYTVNNIGSLCCMFFTKEPVYDMQTAKMSDTTQYAAHFNHMLDNGIYIAPAQFEAMFINNVHTDEDIDYTIKIINSRGK